MGGAFRPLIACLLASLLALLLTGVAYAQSQGSIVGPGESIQKVVDAAERGDTILVRGTHREAVLIRKDDIRLMGDDAVLKPPKRPTSSCPGPTGFCVLGNVNAQTGNVSDYVQDVTITGFTIRNFEGNGIFALGAQDATSANTRAFNNGEYGIAAFASTETRVVSNVTSGSDDAGLYIGDSPRANATIANNETYGNNLGILVRNALGGSQDVELQGNHILGNVPSGPGGVPPGGVVVVRGLEGTPPRDNSVVGNIIHRNRPDIFWDKSGSGNHFLGNHCKTSKPKSLCGS